jgi:hypothetical protein
MQNIHTEAVFPIIFDDSSDLVGSVEFDDGEAQDEGLLAQSDVRAALLSMSGYGKSRYPDTKGKSTCLSSSMFDRFPLQAERTEADRNG